MELICISRRTIFSCPPKTAGKLRLNEAMTTCGILTPTNLLIHSLKLDIFSLNRTKDGTIHLIKSKRNNLHSFL